MTERFVARRSVLRAAGAGSIGLCLGGGSSVSSAVAQSSPTEEVIVEPGTMVKFEVGLPEPDADPLTEFYLDGDWVRDSLGPLQGWDYGYGPAHYFHHTFDSAGSYEVTAITSWDDETEETTWSVTVTADGNTSPSVEAARPSLDETLELERSDTAEFAIDVSDPDGELERVVWWLGHADFPLDTSFVEGAFDTASLSVDVDTLCEGCPIFVWVIDEMGVTITSGLWVIDEIMTEDERYLQELAGDDDQIDTAEMREAIDDWRSDDIDTDRLRQVIDFWRSGDPVR